MAKKKTVKSPNQAVAYMRYSSENQTENSIEYQREAIEVYCLAKGYELVGEYVDEAYTGTNTRRPSFKKMIADAKTYPEWSKVLVFDFSRFARNSGDANLHKNLLADLDVKLISITQEYGESTDAQFMEGINHLFDEHTSQKIGKFTHAGMKQKANGAQHCGGLPPLGYDVDLVTRTLVINETEAEAVRKIFDMYELGYSYSLMAEHLNRNGYRTKTGAEFQKSSFQSILTQVKYTGKYIWNRARAKKRDGRRNTHAEKPIEEQIVVEDGCPVIIEKAQFDRVQIKLENQHGNGNGKSKYHYMLGGLGILRCKECGKLMVGNTYTTHGKKYQVYACSDHRHADIAQRCITKNIRADRVDRLVAAQLAKEMMKREDWDLILAASAQSEQERLLQSKLTGIDKKIQNLLKAIKNGASDAVSSKLKALSEEKRSCELQLSQIKSENDLSQLPRKEIYQLLGQTLATSDHPAVKKYIKAAVEAVWVDNNEVSVVIREA